MNRRAFLLLTGGNTYRASSGDMCGSPTGHSHSQIKGARNLSRNIVGIVFQIYSNG